MELQRITATSKLSKLLDKKQEQKRMSRKEPSKEEENKFPIKFLFFSTCIFVVVACVGIFISSLFQGTSKVLILTISLVAAQLCSVVIPLEANWFWSEAE